MDQAKFLLVPDPLFTNNKCAIFQETMQRFRCIVSCLLCPIHGDGGGNLPRHSYPALVLWVLEVGPKEETYLTKERSEIAIAVLDVLIGGHFHIEGGLDFPDAIFPQHLRHLLERVKLLTPPSGSEDPGSVSRLCPPRYLHCASTFA